MGTWARWGSPPPPPPFVPISNGAGINLQAEVTALRTCLVSGPRQVLPCTLPHHTTARLRGVGAPSTLASAGQKNEQFKGTDVEKKRGVRVTKDGAPLDPYSSPRLSCALFGPPTKEATTLYEIQVYPISMDDDPKCVPVVTLPHPHDQLPPYEIRLIAKPSAYKHSPLPPDLGSCPFSSHHSTTSHPHQAFLAFRLSTQPSSPLQQINKHQPPHHTTTTQPPCLPAIPTPPP